MTNQSKNKKFCKKGHVFYKSSDCPTCPICETERAPTSGFLSLLSAPARRALENEKIDSLKKLSHCTKKELLGLHGFGPASIPILEKALSEKELSFKKP